MFLATIWSNCSKTDNYLFKKKEDIAEFCLLMHLGIAGLYQPKWSDNIHEEWCRNLMNNRPDIEPYALKHTVTLMKKALPDTNVNGFEYLISGLKLPVPDDFIFDLFDLNHALALEAVRKQRQSLRHSPLTVDEFLETLLKQGLPMTAKVLQAYCYAI